MIADINKHPCPLCLHMIGSHKNSPFSTNPKVDIPTSMHFGNECPRTYDSLVIETLTTWLEDALDERDAYMKSYEEISKERDTLQIKLDFALSSLRIIEGENDPATLEEIITHYTIKTIGMIK